MNGESGRAGSRLASSVGEVIPGPRLTLLGGFDLSFDGEIVPVPTTAQRLLAFIALQEAPMRRVYVAGSLWPETSEARAGANMRSALWRLGHPGYALFHLRASHIELAHDIGVDVRDSTAYARALLNYSPRFTEAHSNGTLTLTKDVLPDWSEDWVLIERERFRQLRLHALESLCEQLTIMGRFSEAVQAGLAAVAAEPLRESAHRTLVKTHLAEGNLGEATHQYRIFRQLLHDELALEPSGAMTNLVKGLDLLTIRCRSLPR